MSTAYQASVVLIESERRSRTPLPVLTRGPADRGVDVLAEPVPPFPALERAEPPDAQRGGAPRRDRHAPRPPPRRRRGHRAARAACGWRSRSSSQRSPTRTTARCGSGCRAIRPPSRPGSTPHRSSCSERPSPTARRTPCRSRSRPSSSRSRRAPRRATGTATSRSRSPAAPRCSPPSRRRSCSAAARCARRRTTTRPRRSRSPSCSLPPGQHWLRLRVDGVDSLLVDRSARPPVFDPSQRVEIT